jgi:hypothetical protein
MRHGRDGLKKRNLLLVRKVHQHARTQHSTVLESELGELSRIRDARPESCAVAGETFSRDLQHRGRNVDALHGKSSVQ